jgi:DNA replication protein DnaC
MTAGSRVIPKPSTGMPAATSSKVFGRWGEVFGDDVVAAAMIDRLVHHAEVIALKGDSYRLKDRDLGRVPAAITDEP